jgi:hypothetical protein
MPPLLSHNRFTCLQEDALIQPEIYNIKSKEVIQTISHPPKHQLPGKYVITSSPGSMSLTIDIEIEATDTSVLHRYRYTCRFCMGFSTGMGRGTASETHEQPIPLHYTCLQI